VEEKTSMEIAERKASKNLLNMLPEKHPANTIPPELLSGYTMDGKVIIETKYRDDTNLQVQRMINKQYTKETFEKNLDRVAKRDTNYYGMTDSWLYQALFEYSIEGKDVVIIGSTAPWYEAVALAFGAKTITVFEYSERESFHESIKYKHPNAQSETEKYDVCFSISSVEHDGLGRYGDPLNPNADLETMRHYKTLVKENGLMFLSVPVGEDRVYFNVHRVYGEERFPKLIAHWTPLEYYGFYDGCLKTFYNTADGTPYQPIVVLKNK